MNGRYVQVNEVWNGVRWASRVLGCVVRNLQAENGRCDSSGV